MVRRNSSVILDGKSSSWKPTTGRARVVYFYAVIDPSTALLPLYYHLFPYLLGPRARNLLG
ncbi:hypothetical protein TorRG33x02_324420, partial [Trema orientale]